MSQITTHILDTAQGRPAAGVSVTLSTEDNGGWRELGAGVTDADGRVTGLLGAGPALPAGTYRMHFATAGYFDALGQSAFYPWVEVVFRIAGSGEHYHIPLLLSPYGYSTYRGS